MGDKAAELVQRFHRAMVSPSEMNSLKWFIDDLTGDEANVCLAAYFAVSRDKSRGYSPRDPKSLGVFASLAHVALARGTPLNAVRFEALVHVTKGPWHESFTALQRTSRENLTRLTVERKKSLTRPQRELLPLIESAVRRGTEDRVDEHVRQQGFAEARNCLYLYIEASLRYPDNDRRSLRLFFGISDLTIRKANADFATEYETLCALPFMTWKLRWDGLDSSYRGQLDKSLQQARQRVRPVAALPVLPGSKPTAVTKELVTFFDRFMRAAPPAREQEVALVRYVAERELREARECLSAYLHASARYGSTDSRSLRSFSVICERLLELGKGYEAMKLDAFSRAHQSVFARRFAALPVEADGQSALSRAIQSAMTRPLLLDALKFAYFKEKKHDATLDTLRAFEPESDPEDRQEVRGAARACNDAFGLFDSQRFVDAFNAWGELMTNPPDPLTGLLALKWCRELPDLAPLVKAELYWFGVIAVHVNALKRYPEVYDRGLSAEEREFFLEKTLVSQAYRYELDRRHEQVFLYRRSAAAMLELSRAHVVLLYQAQRMGMTLVSMPEAQRTRARLLALKTDGSTTLSDLRIPINSTDPDAQLSIGSRVGKACVVWWKEDTGRAYVELDGWGRALFEVDSYMHLARMKRDAIYDKIWRDNRHLMQGIKEFFDVLGYLPDLVSGGFAGLVKSVVTDLVVDEIVEQAELGPAAAMILAVGANGLTDKLLDGLRETNGVRVVLSSDDVDDIADLLRSRSKTPFELPTTAQDRGINASAQGIDSPPELPTTRLRDDVPSERPAPPRDEAEPGIHDRERGAFSDGGKHDEGLDAAQPALISKKEQPKKARSLKSDDEKGKSERGRKARRSEKKSSQQEEGDPRSTKGRGLPEQKPPPAKGDTDALPGLITSPDHPALVEPRRMGFAFKFTAVSREKRAVSAEFAKSLTAGTEWKITITSPDGKISFDADYLRVGPDGRVLIGEAKFSAVFDPGDSGNMAGLAHSHRIGKKGGIIDEEGGIINQKVDSISRATLLALESNGLMHVEIVVNVPRLPGQRFAPVWRGPAAAGEIFLGIVLEHLLVKELLQKRFIDKLKNIFGGLGKGKRIPTKEELQELIDELTSVSTRDWGNVPQKYAPKAPPEPLKPPEPPSPPTKRGNPKTGSRMTEPDPKKPGNKRKPKKPRPGDDNPEGHK